MERTEYIVSLVYLVTLLGVYNTIHLVAASKVLTEKTLNEKPQSNVQFTKTKMRMNTHDTFSHMRRSIQEQGDIEPVDACASPNWNMTKPGLISPCPTLDVWVPKNEGFPEFVKVNDHGEVEGGFSIAIFCYALRSLPYNVRPIFKPFIDEKGKSNGTYDELLRKIESQNCAAVAGDVTIRGTRAKYVSFTVPYLSAEVYILVRGANDWNQTLWILLKPFTVRLWITLVWACILTGVALVFLEFREHNPEFVSPLYRQLVMVIWFPISTFFLHEGRIRNKCSKVVLVMWLVMLFVVLQIFTATLSSWLTLGQLYPPRLTIENVGYPNGSFLENLIIQKYNFPRTSLVPLNTIEEYKNTLSNGSVGVIFDELPYIELFLSKYGSKYMKLGPIYQEAGLAFAFPLDSPLLEIFSISVLDVIESDIMMDMKREYLGFSDPVTSSHLNEALPQSLDVQSFIGLFVFMGIVIIAAIVWSEIAIMQRRNKINEEKIQKEEDTILVENFLIFMTVAAIMSSEMSITRRNNRIREEEC